MTLEEKLIANELRMSIADAPRSLRDYISELEKQRDELLAVLERIVHYYDLAKTGSSFPSLGIQAKASHENTMFGAARAAIASVKEQGK